MKIKSLICFVFFVQKIYSQDHSIVKDSSALQKYFSCKYCGIYSGQLDDISNGSSTHINVLLELGSDSVFSYRIGGVFSSCTSMTFYGTGKWFAHNGWFYFKPEVNNCGGSFIMDYTTKPDKQSEGNTKLRYQYANRGYIGSFKTPVADRIYFRIAYDCFDNYWDNNAIKKRKL